MKTPASIGNLVPLVLLALALAAGPAFAQKKYGPGVTDTEIMIGQTMAYSGPISFYGTTGRVEGAYFDDSSEAQLRVLLQTWRGEVAPEVNTDRHCAGLRSNSSYSAKLRCYVRR